MAEQPHQRMIVITEVARTLDKLRSQRLQSGKLAYVWLCAPRPLVPAHIEPVARHSTTTFDHNS